MNEHKRHFGWTSITLPVASITALILAGATTATFDPPGAATYTPAGDVEVLPLKKTTGAGTAHVISRGQGGGDEHTRIISRVHGAGADHSVSVTVNNGEVSVNVDGEEVPAARIKETDDGIIVLDADGKEIKTINIGKWQDGMIQLGVTDNGQMPRFGGRMTPIEPPTVMMGVHIGTPGLALEHHLDLAPGTTTMITAVYDGFGADRAGLDPYDIITAIDGREPADPSSLRTALADLEAGDVIELRVIHKGKAKRVHLEVDAYDADALHAADIRGDASRISVNVEKMFPGHDEQGVVEFPGGQFFLDLENLPNLDNVFVDEDHRIFEFKPGQKMRIFERSEKPKSSDDDVFTGIEEDRIDKLNRRLATLESMLDQLLEEAKRTRKDD